MKKLVVLLLLLSIAGAGFFSCDVASPADSSLTDQEVQEAFEVVFSSYFVGLLMVVFDPDGAEGISMNESTGDIVFTNFDVSVLSNTYSSMSGTVAANESGSTIFNMQLSSGPVRTISFTLDEDFMDAETGTITVRANGSNYQLIITE